MHSAEDDARYEFAHSLTVEAGELALAHFRNLEALVIEEKKSGQDVVSIADREVEDLIRTRISAAFPDDGFLGEETGLAEGASGYRWVVDPIGPPSSHHLRYLAGANALIDVAPDVTALDDRVDVQVMQLD